MDEAKTEPANAAARAGADPIGQPFVTADTLVDLHPPATKPTPGLSQSPGLVEVPDSRVPGLPGGAMVSHVMGPGQAPVDPIAAGLDTGHSPLTRHQSRVITQTGADAAGPGPSTYDDKPGGAEVVDRAPNTHELTAPPE